MYIDFFRTGPVSLNVQGHCPWSVHPRSHLCVNVHPMKHCPYCIPSRNNRKAWLWPQNQLKLAIRNCIFSYLVSLYMKNFVVSITAIKKCSWGGREILSCWQLFRFWNPLFLIQHNSFNCAFFSVLQACCIPCSGSTWWSPRNSGKLSEIPVLVVACVLQLQTSCRGKQIIHGIRELFYFVYGTLCWPWQPQNVPWASGALIDTTTSQFLGDIVECNPPIFPFNSVLKLMNSFVFTPNHDVWAGFCQRMSGTPCCHFLSSASNFVI